MQTAVVMPWNYHELPGYGEVVVRRSDDGSLTLMSEAWPERILVSRQLLEHPETAGFEWDEATGLLTMFDGERFELEYAWPGIGISMGFRRATTGASE